MTSLIIAEVAEKRRRSNVFRRFALMRRWVEDNIPICDLEDGADAHLHTGEWATNCLTEALFDAIMQAVKAEGTT